MTAVVWIVVVIITTIIGIIIYSVSGIEGITRMA